MQRTTKTWTPTEIDLLRAAYIARTPIRRLAAELDRTENSVMTKACLLGLTKEDGSDRAKPKWTTGEDNYMRLLYEKGVAHATIARTLGKTTGAVTSRLHLKGLTRRSAA